MELKEEGLGWGAVLSVVPGANGGVPSDPSDTVLKVGSTRIALLRSDLLTRDNPHLSRPKSDVPASESGVVSNELELFGDLFLQLTAEAHD